MSPTGRRAFLVGLPGATVVPACATLPNPGRRSGGDTAVRVTVDDGVGDREQCRLPSATLEALGVTPGQQIRLLYGGAPAVFTVEVTDGTIGLVSPGGRERLGADGDGFRAELTATVVEPDLDRATAEAEGGFLETLADRGTTKLAVLAPHGGDVEPWTDLQAGRVGDRLEATVWNAAGWWPGGDAFDRWHVTSTAIHPASFPAFGRIVDGDYDHAVSFHGWTESHVGVGGAASRELRATVRDAIAAVVDGVDVRLTTDESQYGDAPSNVVNRVPAGGGVQIEQSWHAREAFGDAIADAVADVFARRTT